MSNPTLSQSADAHRAGASTPSPTSESDGQEISLLGIATVLLTHWQFVMGVPFAAGVAAAILALLKQPQYTATATFVPEVQSGSTIPASIAGLAAQFGVGIPSGGTDSPEFFADVLTSRTLMDQVLRTPFPDPRTQVPSDSATLLDILEIERDSERDRLDFGRRILDGSLSVIVDDETSIVTVSVETPFRPLSADVANHLVALLNDFNLQTRRSNARERRRFVEERVAEAERDLDTAEERLERFLEQNRQFEGSPQLRFQYERLQRQVSMKQEVYTALRRQYEESRIQEVNDTPLITVIDRAVPPEEKSSPRRRLMVLQWFLVGGFVAVIGVFAKAYLDRAGARDDREYRELTNRFSALAASFLSLAGRRRPQ